MERTRFRPFPHIPRYPAEIEEHSVDAEPILEGAPISVDESVFLSHPLIAQCATAIVDYTQGNSAQRRAIVDRYVAESFRSPGQYIELLDVLQALSLEKPYAKAAQLRQDIVHALLGQVQREHMTVERLRGWFAVWTKKEDLGDLIEGMLERVLAKCRSEKEGVDMLYAIALAGYGSPQDSVRHKALRIFNVQTTAVRSHTPGGRFYALGLFSEDDETLKKALEIDGATVFLTQALKPELSPLREGAFGKIVQQPDVVAELDRRMRAQPTRMRAILNLYRRDFDDHGIIKTSQRLEVDEFPMTLAVHNPGPLRTLLNRYIADDIERRGDYVAVPIELSHTGITIRVRSYAETAQAVLSHIPEQGEYAPLITEGNIKTLSYLIPTEAHPDTWVRVREITEKHKKEIASESRYFLSPRGDQISTLDDELLRELNIHSLTYLMNPKNKRETIVDIQVRSHTFRILINEHLELCAYDTQQPLDLGLRGSFLEHTIFAYLHEIRCSDRMNDCSSGAHGRATSDDQRRAFTSRRAHRRLLPVGQQPTQEQIRRILDAYDIDLRMMNITRQARGETQQVTYVYEVEHVAIGGTGPVRSKAPHAMDGLKSIVRI